MSNSTLEIRLAEFKGLVIGVLADGILVLPEIAMLRHWIENHPDLKQQEPFSHIFHLASQIECELDSYLIEKLKKSLEELIGQSPLEVNHKAGKYGIALDKLNADLPPGSRVCLVGNPDFSNSDELKTRLHLREIELDEFVKLNTRLLILAELADDWRTTSYSNIIEQAISYREMGSGLKIIDEAELWKWLNN